MAKKEKQDSKAQGLARLITEATIGITEIVEDMHTQVVHPLFLPSTPIQHLITNIAGITYQNIKWSTQLIGGGLDILLGQLAPVFGEIKTTDEGEAIRSALNGVLGDYLEEKDNPLKITMQFRHEGRAITLDSAGLEEAYAKLNGKILLMVHGSCGNDIQWTRKDHNHGELLAKESGRTPIYLHYNSGLHISSNGQKFNELLEKLVLRWPIPVEELVVISHSMGGLVTRSAVYYAQQDSKTWVKYLKGIVFLGTPHHGALLERVGNYLHMVLAALPYAKPFARLAKIRSAGVTDLRYGNLVNEDWQGDNRFEISGDQRQNIPLPKHVACYSVAGIIGTEEGSSRTLGDGLVGVKSAFGQHKIPNRNLKFKEENTWIAYETNHLDLLSNPEVYSKIKAWLD